MAASLFSEWKECNIIAKRAERTSSTELANCRKLIHSALLVCRRDELGMHQVVFKAGGAVMDNIGFFLEYITWLYYESVFE